MISHYSFKNSTIDLLTMHFSKGSNLQQSNSKTFMVSSLWKKCWQCLICRQTAEQINPVRKSQFSFDRCTTKDLILSDVFWVEIYLHLRRKCNKTDFCQEITLWLYLALWTSFARLDDFTETVMDPDSVICLFRTPYRNRGSNYMVCV